MIILLDSRENRKEMVEKILCMGIDAWIGHAGIKSTITIHSKPVKEIKRHYIIDDNHQQFIELDGEMVGIKQVTKHEWKWSSPKKSKLYIDAVKKVKWSLRP